MDRSVTAELAETKEEPQEEMPPMLLLVLPPVPLTISPLLDGVRSSVGAEPCELDCSGRCGRAGDCILPWSVKLAVSVTMLPAAALSALSLGWEEAES